jgi:predicted nucleic acid-binding protein
MTQPNDAGACVVDTMVLSALLDTRTPGRGDRYRAILGDRAIVASFMSAAEILYGIERARWGDVRRRAVERDLARISIERPDDEAVRIYASQRADCERRGHALGQKIHEADRWVAVSALRLRLPLLSDDGVFEDVPGLTLLAGEQPT